jgi:hypothetical protein
MERITRVRQSLPFAGGVREAPPIYDPFQQPSDERRLTSRLARPATRMSKAAKETLYRRFPVPVDGTDACIEAISLSIAFARSTGARITLPPVLREPAATHRNGNAARQAHGHLTTAAGTTEDREWELLARAEVAARAQGLPCSSSAATDAARLRPHRCSWSRGRRGTAGCTATSARRRLAGDRYGIRPNAPSDDPTFAVNF